MTAADIPLTLGQPDQGFEGNRFTGIPLYDALVEWDLSQGEKPSGIVPDWPPSGMSTAEPEPLDLCSASGVTFMTAPGQRQRHRLERRQSC